MTQRKAHQVASFVAKPEKEFHLILLYGPDQGLVSENADRLVKSLSLGTSNPVAVTRFNADEIASEPGRLADEAFSISMFGDEKIIRIQGTTRKNILLCLKPVFDTPLSDCRIIYEAGDLKRESAIRKRFENSDNAIALPCYQDSAAALDQLIEEEILGNNISIDRETIAYLRSFLGEDRRASRNELKKLALYALGEEKITRDQITALLGNVSTVANDDIVDAVCQGNTNFLASKFDQLMESGGTPDMLVWATLRQFQLLHKFKSAMNINKANPASLIASVRPPIHFSRHKAMTRSLQLWSVEKCETALTRLNNAFFEVRSKPALAKSIAATTLLAVALQATRK